MDTKCDVIKDLLPLYIDDICSKESRRLVSSHLDNCEECLKLYNLMKTPISVENTNPEIDFEKQQVESLKKVHKKQKTKKTILITTSAIAGVIVTAIFIRVLFAFGIIAFIGLDAMLTKPEVHNDPSEYNLYVHADPYDFETFSGDRAAIFPAEITSDMNVIEFQYTYYNPWDAQYVVYLTVDYTDEAYANEMLRLQDLGIERYTEYYSVTDEPAGYDLVAMNSDYYQGFVYAMIPENSDGNRITYVGIWFCNYFLDLDIHKYLPDEYLLTGFDATSGNPYEVANVHPGK